MQNIPKRLLQHLLTPQWRIKRVLPGLAMSNIEKAIGESENFHSGEIRFAVEAALDPLALLRGTTARQRAIEVFSQLRIWDTEHNNGVLIYLLLADRDIEIIADRGINAHLDQHTWQSICQRMEKHFGVGNFEQGILSGISEISARLTQHFPAVKSDHNELSNQPHIL